VDDDTDPVELAREQMVQAANARHRHAYRKAVRLLGHARDDAITRANEALELGLEAACRAAVDPEHGNSGPGGPPGAAS
jgi:hypothetical protein